MCLITGTAPNIKFYGIDGSHTVTYSSGFTGSPVPSAGFMDSANIFLICPNSSVSSSALQIRDKVGSLPSSASTVQLSYDRMAVNPTRTRGLIWNNLNEVTIYDLQTLTNLSYWAPANPPPVSATAAFSYITFSADSELAVIETDAYNPIQIINLTSLKVIKEVSISETILYASFLNSSNAELVVVCPTAIIVVDLSTLKSYRIN
jgi:hypothetical protein